MSLLGLHGGSGRLSRSVRRTKESWTETRAPTSWVTSMTNYCSPCRRLIRSSHLEESSSCCRNINNICEQKFTVVKYIKYFVHFRINRWVPSRKLSSADEWTVHGPRINTQMCWQTVLNTCCSNTNAVNSRCARWGSLKNIIRETSKNCRRNVSQIGCPSCYPTNSMKATKMVMLEDKDT